MRGKQGSFLGMFSLDYQMIIPLKKFQNIYGARFYPTIEAWVDNPRDMEDAKEELRAVMRKLRGLSPSQADDFSIIQQDLLTNEFNKIAGTIGAARLFVTSLALFVGGIGIMNIMFVSVTERTREIEIRKALGTQRRTILIQFLIESSLICLGGGFVGLGLSYPLSILIVQLGLPTSMPVSLAILGITISLAVGIVSGMIPAMRASRLDPVEALRYE